MTLLTTLYDRPGLPPQLDVPTRNLWLASRLRPDNPSTPPAQHQPTEPGNQSVCREWTGHRMKAGTAQNLRPATRLRNVPDRCRGDAVKTANQAERKKPRRARCPATEALQGLA